MSHHLHRTVAFVFVLFAVACGGEKPARQHVKHLPVQAERRHDYSSTWVYTVGEVESPTQNDCAKAFGYINDDANCIGKACERAVTLIRDYEFTCGKFSTKDERARVSSLMATYTERSRQPMTQCLEKAEAWLDRGCGENGACEARAQRWATQCSQSTQSKLLIHLLERLIENSLLEPRRVTLDTRSCEDFAKEVDAVASCSKPFDCEDALPKVEDYLQRCAQGKTRAVPLRTAFSIAKIRLGTEKPFDPITLTSDVVKTSTVFGSLSLVDQSGVVLKVCDEPVSDLKSYLEQRSSCKNGSLTLLRITSSPTERKLVLTLAPHDSDEQFLASYPSFLVRGETEERALTSLTAFTDAMRALPERAADDFAGALSKANVAFANVPPQLRKSAKLREALSSLDTALSPLFTVIASAKVSMAGTKLSDADLIAFIRRSETLVFADVTTSGNIEIGALVELSELLTKEALPNAFTAYDQGLESLRKQLKKRKITPALDLDTEAQIAIYTQNCSAARTKFATQQKKLEQCLLAENDCDPKQREVYNSEITAAKLAWSEARVRELVAKVSSAQPVVPSSPCSVLSGQ